MTAETQAKSSSHGPLGSLMLLGGMIVLALRGLESVNALPSLPRFWHTNDALWWGMGLGMAAFGVWLLAQTSETKDRHGWRPTRSGRRFQHLILYTRVGCHLCEEARDVLTQYGRWLPEIVEVDIDHDPRLAERYGKCVPVIAFDGKVRFRGRVVPELLRRLIEATPPALS